jgi:hypothetical protein
VAPEKPIKRRGLKALVQRLVGEGRLTISRHARDEMKDDDVTQVEILRVLKLGKREAQKDKLEGSEYRYAFRGWDAANERWIRVIVGVPPDDVAVVVVTVINLSGKGRT